SSLTLQFRRVPGRDSAQVVTPFVQVGTYPTRNFARIPPYVAIGSGPYLHLYRRNRGGWRMASEDSRYRDRCRRFMDSVIFAIRSKPSGRRCSCLSTMAMTLANLSKSYRFAVLSGLRSKNGMIIPISASLALTESLHKASR